MDKMMWSNSYKKDIESILFQKCDWSRFQGKVILISGATGLIGTFLSDMLIFLNEKFSLGMTLLLLSRHEHDFNLNYVRNIKHDISKPLEIDEKIDFIIHAASNTHPLQYSQFPIETITTNVFGSYNLLNLSARNKDCRFLLVSSVEIYGDDTSDSEEGFTETDMGYLECNSSRACYNESKRMSETLCAAFCAERKIDYVIARLCRSYGSTLKKDDSKALSQFFRNAINGENIVLKSEGNQYYSYIYAADAASAIIFLLLNGKSGESYNVADAKSNITLKDLAKLVGKYAKTVVIYNLPSETEKKGFSKAQKAILNPAKLHTLGWSAQFDIENGIRRTLEELKKAFNFIDY